MKRRNFLDLLTKGSAAAAVGGLVASDIKAPVFASTKEPEVMTVIVRDAKTREPIPGATVALVDIASEGTEEIRFVADYADQNGVARISRDWLMEKYPLLRLNVRHAGHNPFTTSTTPFGEITVYLNEDPYYRVNIILEEVI